MLARCLAKTRPRDALLLLEQASARADCDLDSTFASYESWEKNHPNQWGRRTSAAEVLGALATLRPEHSLVQPLANALVLQCGAQPWARGENMGDALGAIVDYALVGGVQNHPAPRPVTESPTPEAPDLVARIPRSTLRLTRSYSLQSESGDGARDLGELRSSRLECRAGDTLVVTVILEAKLGLSNVSVTDPLPAGCEPLVTPAARWNPFRETWLDHAVELSFQDLPAGRSELKHRLVARHAGEFHVPRATAALIYFPALSAASQPMTLAIAPP